MDIEGKSRSEKPRILWVLALLVVSIVVFVGWIWSMAERLRIDTNAKADQFMDNPNGSGLTVYFEGVKGAEIPAELGSQCQRIDEYRQISGAPYGFTAVCPGGKRFKVQVDAIVSVSVVE